MQGTIRWTTLPENSPKYIEKFRGKPIWIYPEIIDSIWSQMSRNTFPFSLSKSLQDTQAHIRIWPPMVVSDKAHVLGTPTWSQVRLLVSELLELYSAQPQVVSNLNRQRPKAHILQVQINGARLTRSHVHHSTFVSKGGTLPTQQEHPDLTQDLVMFSLRFRGLRNTTSLMWHPSLQVVDEVASK